MARQNTLHSIYSHSIDKFFVKPSLPYRGRLAPTPSGHLHLGHMQTFLIAAWRAHLHQGQLVLRIEDIDRQRCKPAFLASILSQLAWIGLVCDEGPTQGGPYAPYIQSQRMDFYRSIWEQLKHKGCIYPCQRSRQDVERALRAPHLEDERAEPIFPLAWRGDCTQAHLYLDPGRVNWRFQVPDGEQITFLDGRLGMKAYTAGIDFGDFIIWRKDGVPAYELAVVADDYAMRISEVVRGEDLLLSTARQILLYRALNRPIPQFFHVPLVLDEKGQRLSKRLQALSMTS